MTRLGHRASPDEVRRKPLAPLSSVLVFANTMSCPNLSLGLDMRRREFIAVLGGAAAWPVVARAQQPVMPVVGYLNSGLRETDGAPVRAVQQGLTENGFVEGKNVSIEYRWAEGQFDRLPELAADLVRRKVDVIVTIGGTPDAFAAKSATTAIPIVFGVGTNPVEVGLVESLNRPEGNLTGVTILSAEVAEKRVDLLRELVPKATAIALLANPNNRLIEAETRAVKPKIACNVSMALVDRI